MNLEENNIGSLFKIVDLIKERGNFVLIKFDGERDNEQITVIIDYPRILNKEQIRFNGNKLAFVLKKAIDRYLENNEL